MLLNMLSYVSFVPPAGRLISIRTVSAMSRLAPSLPFMANGSAFAFAAFEGFPLDNGAALAFVGFAFVACFVALDWGSSSYPDNARKTLKTAT